MTTAAFDPDRAGITERGYIYPIPARIIGLAHRATPLVKFCFFGHEVAPSFREAEPVAGKRLVMV
jgi:hypothetical protein